MSGNRTIWVYGVSDDVTNDAIKKEFSGSGKVLRIDRSSRGFCHVTFSNHQEAEHAIRTKNRDFFQGRFIKVEPAKIEEQDDTCVQGKLDRARTNWQRFCIKEFICENWNIYDCPNAVPGGCCYNGHHFCMYCKAMGNGHQPHKNVDPSCPCRRPGWQEMQRFKSARERELAVRRLEGIAARGGSQREVESIAASGSSQRQVDGSAARGRSQRQVEGITVSGGSQCQVDGSAARGGSQRQVDGSAASGRSQRQVDGIAASGNLQRQVDGIAGADSRIGNTAAFSITQQEPISSLKSNNPGSNNLETTSSIRETGPNNLRFKAMVVEANKWFSVVLSSGERGPKDFNVQLKSSKNQLAKIMNVINQKDLLRPLNHLEITDGKPCLAMSGSDGIIYRAMVLEYAQQQVVVYFLDYGKVEKLAVDKLFSISDELIQQPALSLRCRLNNWPNFSESNKALAKERLKQYENRNLKCRVLDGKDVELRDEGDNDVSNDIQEWINTRNGPEQTATREKLKELLLNRKAAHKPVDSLSIVDAKKPRLTSEVENRSEANRSAIGTKEPRFVFPERMYQKFSPRSKRNPLFLCAPRMNKSGENRMSYGGDVLSRVNQASNMFINSFAGNLSNNALLCHKTVQLSFPTNKMDAVVGPNGARLQQIRKESMTSITIGASGEETFITIKGSVQGIKSARAMLQQGLLDN